MKHVWRLLDVSYDDDPYMNLAVEEAINRKVGAGIAPNTIRFWKNRNAVVIGRYQSVALEVNLEVCERHNVTLVRRFTGGGTVYHDNGNLNFSMSIHKDDSSISSGFYETFYSLSLGAVEGLRILGLNPKLKQFNIIQIGNRKVCGLAGSIRWGTLFLHGSILVNSDLDFLSAVLNVPTIKLEHDFVHSVRRSVNNLANVLRRDITIPEVKHVLIKGFEKTFFINLVTNNLLEEEVDLAQKLYKEKYTKKEWNFER